MSSMCLIKQIWVEQQPDHPQLLGLELGLPMPGVPVHPEWAAAEMFTCEEQQEEGANNNDIN